MSQGQGQGQQNSSSGIEVAYYSGAIVFGSVFLWYAYSAYIIHYTFLFTWYQGYALLVPIDFINQQLAQWFPTLQMPDYLTGNRLYTALTEIELHTTIQSAAKVSIGDWLRVIGVVGEYWMLVTSPLWLFASFYLFTHSITGRFKDKYSMEKFRELESTNWPAICTSLGKNYAKTDLDTGDFAMSMQPMKFAKKYNLLDVEQIEGKTVATVNRERAFVVFSTQMGPPWEGDLKHMPSHILALFAIFAAKAEHDTKSSAKLLAQLSRSSTRGNKKLDFSGVNEVLFKHIGSMKIARAVGPHAFLYPAMASLLELAREDGVLASAEFLWLKLIDRPLWYMLNSVGRKTAFPEISGPYAHWVVEKRLRRPLKTPMVEEAINALESGVGEFIYKKDDE